MGAVPEVTQGVEVGSSMKKQHHSPGTGTERTILQFFLKRKTQFFFVIILQGKRIRSIGHYQLRQMNYNKDVPADYVIRKVK